MPRVGHQVSFVAELVPVLVADEARLGEVDPPAVLVNRASCHGRGVTAEVAVAVGRRWRFFLGIQLMLHAAAEFVRQDQRLHAAAGVPDAHPHVEQLVGFGQDERSSAVHCIHGLPGR